MPRRRAPSVVLLIQTPYTEESPQFSPDGHWLLYVSNVTGRREIYVRPYPGSGPVEAVSLEGGSDPAWHPNGRELFFLSRTDPPGQRKMMVVDFAPGSPPRIGRPRPLFEFDQRALFFHCQPVRCYDVAPDGQRFIVMQVRPAPPLRPVTRINLKLKWLEELRAKVPTGR